MRKMLLTAALFAAGAAAAQPAPPIDRLGPTRSEREARDEPRGAPRGAIFISPSGEPFRGGDGLATWFAQADADRDGAITQLEFQADALRAFRLYDANNDGVVDGFEGQAYERERVPEIAEVVTGPERPRRGFGRRRSGEGDGREGAARFGLINEPQPLLAADYDIDGRVSLAEWKRATDRRFAALDRAHTAKLTMEVLRPAGAKSR